MADGTIIIDTSIDSNMFEKEMKDTELAIKKTEAQLDRLIEKQIRFVETGGNINSRTFQTMEYDIAQTSAALDALRAKQSVLNAQQTASMQTTEDKVNRVKNAFKKLGGTLSNVGKKVLGIGKNAKTSGRSLTKMLLTSLLMGLAFMALMAVINGLKEGMDNLAQYSGDVNKDLSVLKSSLTQLKNSFATAFAPILNVVTPILSHFMNIISQVVSKIGMLIAALSGKKTFTKAIAVQEDYAAGLSDSAKAAKKASKSQKDYNTGLDEMNRASSSNSASSGATSGVSPSEMFEEIEIPSGFQTVAKKIRTIFGNIVKSFKPIGEKLKTTIKKIKELWTVIKEKLGPVFEEFSAGPLQSFGAHIIETIGISIDRFNYFLEFLIGVFTGDWERAFKGLEGIVGTWGEQVEADIKHSETMFSYFDNYLQKVFAIDWVESFGVMGYGLESFFVNVKNIWSGIKQIFYGINNFVGGVFTGDWRRAWQGIRDIFGGIFKSLIALAKSPINSVIGFINAMIRAVVTGINSAITRVNKLSYTVPDWVPKIGGKNLDLI